MQRVPPDPEMTMTKKTFVAFVTACALVACGGGTTASSGETRQGSHPDQGTAAPHIECGSGTGHHGGGCGDGTSDGTSGGTTTTTTTTTTGTAPPPATTATP